MNDFCAIEIIYSHGLKAFRWSMRYLPHRLDTIRPKGISILIVFRIYRYEMRLQFIHAVKCCWLHPAEGKRAPAVIFCTQKYSLSLLFCKQLMISRCTRKWKRFACTAFQGADHPHLRPRCTTACITASQHFKLCRDFKYSKGSECLQLQDGRPSLTYNVGISGPWWRLFCGPLTSKRPSSFSTLINTLPSWSF